MTAERPDHVLTEIHAFGATALAYTPDGQRFISGGFRGDLRVWDAATRKPLADTHGYRRAVRAILPLPSDDVVSGSDDGRLILWRDGRIQAQHDGAAVTSLALFQGQMVSGHADGRVVALSAHGAYLAVRLGDRILVLDTILTPRQTLPPRTPHDLQFSPDGRHLATLGRHTDSAIRILDTADFSMVKRYQTHALYGAIIRFSPDGHTLASGSDDESVHLHRLGKAFYSSSGAIPSAH